MGTAFHFDRKGCFRFDLPLCWECGSPAREQIGRIKPMWNPVVYVRCANRNCCFHRRINWTAADWLDREKEILRGKKERMDEAWNDLQWAAARYGLGSMYKPRECFVYIIEEGEGTSTEAVIKIGIGENVGTRLAALQTGNSRPLRIVTQWKLSSREQARLCEQHAHNQLASDRIHGEWFRTNPIGAMCSIDEYLGLVE